MFYITWSDLYVKVSVEEKAYVRSLGLICTLQVSVEEKIMFDHLV